MTTYTVQAPDGKQLTLEGPPGASEADVISMAQQLYAPAAKPEEKEDPGIIGSLTAGLGQSVKDFAKTKQAISGDTPEEDVPDITGAQPMELSDLVHPITLGKKAAYMLGEGAPSIAGGVAGALGGGALGGMAGGLPGAAVGAVAGEVLGAGAFSAAQQLGPYYARAIKDNPDNPEVAFDLALKQAATEGVFTGASFGLFRLAPFKRQVANILTQAFGIQPAVSAAGQVSQNLIEGKDATEGLKEGYLPSALGTIVPLVGTHLASKLLPKAKEKPKPPPGQGEFFPQEELGKKPGQEEMFPDEELGAKKTPEAEQPELDFEGPLSQQSKDAIKKWRERQGASDENGNTDVGGTDESVPPAVRKASARRTATKTAGPDTEGVGAVGGDVEPAGRGESDSVAALKAEKLSKIDPKFHDAFEKGFTEAQTATELPKSLKSKSKDWRQAHQIGWDLSTRLEVEKLRAAREQNNTGPRSALTIGDEHVQAVQDAQGLGFKDAADKLKAPKAAPVREKLDAALNVLHAIAFETRDNLNKFSDVHGPEAAGDMVKGLAAPHVDTAINALKDLKVREEAEQGVVKVNTNEDVEAAKRPEAPKKDEEPVPREKVANDIQWLTRDAATEVGNKNYGEAIQHLQTLKDILNNGEYARESAYHDPLHEVKPHPTVRRVSPTLRREPELIPPRRVEKGPLRSGNTDRGVKLKLPEVKKGTTKGVLSEIARLLKKGKIEARDADWARNEIKKGTEPTSIRKALTAFAENKRKRTSVSSDTIREQGYMRSLEESDDAAPKSRPELTEAPFSPEFDAKRAELGKVFNAKLKQYGLPELKVLFPDFLRMSHDNGDSYFLRGGYGKKVITLALSGDNIFGTFDHEVVHALRDLGLFTDKEWNILSRRAKDDWIKKHNIERRYSKRSDEGRIEEAIADGFKYHADGTGDPFMRAMMRKIRNFFTALRETLRGNGFDTPDKIFARIKSGEIGARERGESKAAYLADREATLQADIKSSPDPRVVSKSVGELMKETRSADRAISLLKSGFDAMKVGAMKKVLYTLTMDDITRWAGDRLKNLAVVNEYQRAKEAMRAGMIRDLNAKSKDWVEFYKTHRKGADVLADLIHRSTLNGVEADSKGLGNALATDKELKVLRSHPKPDSKKIFERENQIKEVYGLWNKLAGYGGGKGHEIYTNALKDYREIFQKHYDTLVDNIKHSYPDPAEQKELIDKVGAMFSKAKQIGVYAPLKRYGKYWLRVGESGDRSREFHMFESATARNQAARDIAKDMNSKNDTRAINMGDDIETVRNHLGGSDDLLKSIHDIIDKKGSDPNGLKDLVNQMWLSSLPGADIRKSSLHRKGVAGYDPDALRTYIAHHLTAANQLSRLAYGDKMRNAVGAMYGELEVKNNENPRPDQLKLKAFADHIKKAVDKELSYSDPGALNLDRFASLGNKAVFYYMLSSPKSALVQMTQLPLVGLPVLSTRYGAAPAAAMMGKYFNFMNTLAARGSKGELTWAQPSVKNSKHFQSSPLKKELQYGFDQAVKKWDLFMNTYAADMNERSRVSSPEHEGAVNQGFRAVAKLMSGSFHHMERMSRELMYMSAYELELKKNLKSGMSHDEKTRVMDQAADRAADAVYQSLFNYTTYNKPLLMKSGALPKLATQFMTFPLQMTSYLSRNFYQMLPLLNKEGKAAAATHFFGTLGMTGMFAGVVGLPGYSMVMGLAQGMRDLFMDPSENEDMYEDEDGNPIGAKNLDLWFRESFLPKHFGVGSDLQKTLGLSDEAANTLQRSIKMGPVSGLTNWDVSASTSLNDLWFRNDTPSDSAKNFFQQTAFDLGLGAFGSMGTQAASALDDFEKGETNRGIEKLLPAFFRGPARALRFATEGNLTPQGDEIKNAEYYTTGRLLAQTIGFGSTEVDEMQKANFMAKNLVLKMEKERTQVLDRLVRAYQKNDEVGIDAAFDAVDKYNDENSILPITGSTVAASLKNRQKRGSTAMEGLELPDNVAPYFDELLSDSRQ